MNSSTANDRDAALENLAAELTNAVYPVMLQHGIGDNKWLELELDLWKALTEAVKRLELAEGDGVEGLNVPLRTSEFFG